MIRAAHLGPDPEGADRLWYARQVRADLTSHEDAMIAAACHLIETDSPDPAERAAARDLRALIEGAGSPLPKPKEVTP